VVEKIGGLPTSDRTFKSNWILALSAAILSNSACSSYVGLVMLGMIRGFSPSK